MQKFQKHDLVQISKDLGPSMEHFTKGCEAIILGSYHDQFGGQGGEDTYSLFIEGKGHTSWYLEDQLILIEKNRVSLLIQWQEDLTLTMIKVGDLDWIFSHGGEVLSRTHGSTASALGKIIGIESLWGADGEGITWYENAMYIMKLAKPYLEKGDKKGFIDLGEQLKLAVKNLTD